ncbi:cytochrome b [Rhodoplanes sp. Z2-YC6860]|uniref:cytochrome b n=1 Tax=Rhodoplanes sp. Z2-YC6860 TaxID=674703 RepID=UPI00078EB701|nr:cytochrome b/b6 domain-containing protein [Rhodoplanes sp. Z2-YC6860]AMN38498.1 cytochrome B561 [Rhodoplanes sp. Z2-YC6860]
MKRRLQYGTTAKALHWVVVALLVVQYSIGWLMPDVHGGPPGSPMTWHVSIGMVALGLIAARFGWRLTHPVAPESSLPAWQRITSEGVHWLLHLLVLLTTLSGWLFASARGWTVSLFFVAPLPMLTSGDRALVKALNGWHQNFIWFLLAVAGLHVAAAFVHLFYYRDDVMRRILPGDPVP